MSNKLFAARLVNAALSAPPKIEKPNLRWRGGHLFRSLTPWQYSVLKGLVEESLDQRDECREAGIKAMVGLWMDYDHLAYPLTNGSLERLKKISIPGIGVFYQFDRQAATDWFDAIRDGNVIQLESGNNG